jgi:hypothetical protein
MITGMATASKPHKNDGLRNDMYFYKIIICFERFLLSLLDKYLKRRRNLNQPFLTYTIMMV